MTIFVEGKECLGWKSSNDFQQMYKSVAVEGKKCPVKILRVSNRNTHLSLVKAKGFQ